jgi:melibiose permease/lactose/raffinose/galactose permease
MTNKSPNPDTTKPDSQPSFTRNKWTFSIGTLGRDMTYALVASYLIFYLTEALHLSNTTLGIVSTILVLARIFDAFTDIIMGSIVDNTHTRWGQFKPWILGGVLASAIITLLLFTDFGLSGGAYIAVFTIVYLAWGLSWTANDIPYWSLMPALSMDQKQREQISALTKMIATIGSFTVVITVIPGTNALGKIFGTTGGWTAYVAIIMVVMIIFQLITVIFVRQPKLVVEQERVTIREIFGVVVKNDQLLWTAIAMVLFMTGYSTTSAFGTYYFKYVFGDENMYTSFGAVLGVAQIAGFLIFPLLRKRFSRTVLFTISISMMLLGYVMFFLAPMNIIFIGICGLLIFVGTSFILVLMLSFITDTIDYGHWKLGRRNTAITFSLQPFINKVGAALGTEIVAITLIFSGINEAATPADVSSSGITMLKIAMMGLPAVLIALSYVLYRWKYKIDEKFHDQIISDLKDRGQIVD